MSSTSTRLTPDARPTPPTLGEFLIDRQADFPFASGGLTRLLNSIRLAAKVVNHNVNQAGLVDITGRAGDINVQGEDQQKLDVFADVTFINTLTNREIVCGIASEENEDFIVVPGSDGAHKQHYVVLIDPLDGSSNIDICAPVGTVFSIYRRISPQGTPVVLEDFLQAGNMQVAAGYILYGTSTIMVFTTGNGVNGFTLNPAIGTYYLSHPEMSFPDKGSIYSINEGKYATVPAGRQGLPQVLPARGGRPALHEQVHRGPGRRLPPLADQGRDLPVPADLARPRRQAAPPLRV